MLEAVPKNIFANGFFLQQQNVLLGEIDSSIWHEKEAQLELEEGTYLLYRERHFSGDFVLEHEGKVLARARKPSAIYNTFEVELPDRHLVLRKPSAWNRRFSLFDGEKEVGSIYPLNLLTQRANVGLPADWPLAIRAFLFWLVLIIWRRQQSG